VQKPTISIPKRQKEGRGRTLIDITMILAKLQDATAKLLSVHFFKK
jgi:hypothetical protein